jgi:DNA mismatch repair protein MutL
MTNCHRNPFVIRASSFIGHSSFDILLDVVMADIRQLSPSVVNKIAAGEVIERPASVVKELMENTVDAGATRIDVSLAQGGGELVRVVDNGCGIAAEQLTLAVAPHATSKIREADDLFRVGTLGFRGEALASIAEVSRTVIRSRSAGAEAGAELEISGGQIGPVTPCGCPPGTLIEVHNLFFNTPVRRKFLRATQTELAHSTEAFTRLALAYPKRHFTLRHHDKLLHDLPPTDDWPARIAAFFGADLAEQLIRVESRDGALKLSGYVANPAHSRTNQRMQFLFLNGRAIRDRSLQHALGEAYRGLLLTGRYPIAFLEIEMPPEEVDVNVHPTKLEVRFQDGGRLYSQLLGTLRTRFLTTDLTAKLQPAAVSAGDGDPTQAHDPGQAAQLQDELVAWAKGQLAQVRDATHSAETSGNESMAPLGLGGNETVANGDSQTGPTRSVDPNWPAHRPLELVSLDRSRLGGATSSPDRAAAALRLANELSLRPGDLAMRSGGLAPSLRPRPAAIQIHNRYLVAETDEGVVVIDQHALHERVLYEEIREKVLAGALETQRLLVPEPVDLAPAESAAAMAERELLARLGVEIEPFGGGTILVVGYPAMLSKLSPTELLRGLAAQLLEGTKTPDRRDLLDDLLHMIACKAAIKAGDPLSAEEVAALVEQRHLAQDCHHCPHGRPTALHFTRDELDKQFKRT